MSNIVVPVLSVTIGLFFVLVGTIKLTPFISEEFYKEMVGLFLLLVDDHAHSWATAPCNVKLQDHDDLLSRVMTHNAFKFKCTVWRTLKFIL